MSDLETILRELIAEVRNQRIELDRLESIVERHNNELEYVKERFLQERAASFERLPISGYDEQSKKDQALAAFTERLDGWIQDSRVRRGEAKS